MPKVNKDDVDKLIDNDIYLPTRTLYVGSVSEHEGESLGVDYAMAERTVKNLHILESSAPLGDKPINIILNTEGGYWEHGMAMYDAIRKCKNHVTITVSGQAMSMGSIILQAADERLIEENATFMIHYGELNVGGHVKTVYRWADSSKKNDRKMEDIFLARIRVAHPDFQRKKLFEMLKFDTILDAREAVLLGLADGVDTPLGVLRRKDLMEEKKETIEEKPE